MTDRRADRLTDGRRDGQIDGQNWSMSRVSIAVRTRDKNCTTSSSFDMTEQTGSYANECCAQMTGQ